MTERKRENKGEGGKQRGKMRERDYVPTTFVHGESNNVTT